MSDTDQHTFPRMLPHVGELFTLSRPGGPAPAFICQNVVPDPDGQRIVITLIRTADRAVTADSLDTGPTERWDNS